MSDNSAQYLSAAYTRVAALVDELVAECQWLYADLQNVGINDPNMTLVKQREITALQTVASTLRSYI